MAEMGFRTFRRRWSGQMQMLDKRHGDRGTGRPKGLDFFPAVSSSRNAPAGVHIHNCEVQDHKIHTILDRRLIAQAQSARSMAAAPGYGSRPRSRTTDPPPRARWLSGEIAQALRPRRAA